MRRPVPPGARAVELLLDRFLVETCASQEGMAGKVHNISQHSFARIVRAGISLMVLICFNYLK